MRELGLSPLDFRLVDEAPSYEEKCKRLEDLQKRAKRGFKEAALRLHSDIPENRTEEKGDLFKLVGQAIDDIANLRVRHSAPVRRVIIMQQPMVFTASFSGANTDTPTSTGTGSMHFNIRFV